jgi:hypothetical protein
MGQISIPYTQRANAARRDVFNRFIFQTLKYLNASKRKLLALAVATLQSCTIGVSKTHLLVSDAL